MNYLIYRANSTGTCFPTIKTITKDCHIGINTAKRALDDLVEASYVKKEARFIEAKNGAQTSNLYTLSEGVLEVDDASLEQEDNTNSEVADIPQETFEDMVKTPHLVSECSAEPSPTFPDKERKKKASGL